MQGALCGFWLQVDGFLLSHAALYNCDLLRVYCSPPTQVHLSSKPEVYNRVPGDTMGEHVNKNLFFDKTQSHIYITTEKKVAAVKSFIKALSVFGFVKEFISLPVGNV